jgi:hypothetical protein
MPYVHLSSPHSCHLLRPSLLTHVSMRDVVASVNVIGLLQTLKWRLIILIYLFHGAESLRSQPILSQSRNSPHFMEPEGSLPHLQVPATCSILDMMWYIC